jgi:hypothetical protein
MKLPINKLLLLFIITDLFEGVHASAEVNVVTNLAPNVYFHEGELKGRGHCNNGWIVFED